MTGLNQRSVSDTIRNIERRSADLLHTRGGRTGGEVSRRGFIKGTAAVISVAVAVVSLMVLPAACGPKTAILPGQGSNEVWIADGRIYPEKLVVSIGTTVTWTNKDSKAHTVTSDANVFSESLPPGGTFSYTFTEHKNYRYRCSTHPRMKGLVFVEPDLTTGCDDCHA